MKLISKIWLVLTLCLLEIGLQAQMRPLPKPADVPKLKQDAAKGDLVALYQLSVCYSEEIGVPMDFKEALNLATRAAEKDDVPAMVALSYMYSSNVAVKRDKRKAYEWAKRAADTGNPLGLVALARCYGKGYVVEKSEAEEIHLLRKAAESDNDYAVGQLALAYIWAEIAHRNIEEGLRLARIAESRGQQSGTFILGLAYLTGMGVKQDMELARIYAERLRSAGGRSGDLILGLLTLEQQNPDYHKAANYIQRAAKIKIPRALWALGMLHIEGKGVAKSTTEAVKLWRMAAQMGDANGMHSYAYVTFHGQGRVADLALGLGLFQAAAAIGNEHTQAEIAKWDYNYKQSPDYIKGSLIAQSIKRQLDAGDDPIELAEGYHSSQFGKAPVPDNAVRPSQRQVASGTGMIFDDIGHCFTNHHVIEGASEIRIFIPSARKTLKARVVASDMANDLAVLKIEDWKPISSSHPTPPPLASASKAKIGDKAFTIGFPLSTFLESQEHKYASGDISATSGISEDRRVFQITTPIQPGNSGGPLCLPDGRVIGVIVSTVNSVAVMRDTKSIPQNINFAVKIDYLKLLASSSGIDMPEDLKPGPDPIEHVKAYTVQVIAER